MNMGIKYDGVASEKELKNCPGVPALERMKKGRVSVIECVQEIPCNPCELACPFGAITIGESITSLPRLDEDKCTGCGKCIAACPGLAIFVVDLSYEEKRALVEFPYEYLPLPKTGQKVPAVNRHGEVVGQAEVINVKNPKGYNNTKVISIAIPKDLAFEVRSINRQNF